MSRYRRSSRAHGTSSDVVTTTKTERRVTTRMALCALGSVSRNLGREGGLGSVHGMNTMMDFFRVEGGTQLTHQPYLHVCTYQSRYDPSSPIEPPAGKSVPWSMYCFCILSHIVRYCRPAWPPVALRQKPSATRRIVGEKYTIAKTRPRTVGEETQNQKKKKKKKKGVAAGIGWLKSTCMRVRWKCSY